MKTTIDLWDGVAPGHKTGFAPPLLHYYPTKNKCGRGAVVICPGGAYVTRAQHEGRGYAEYLNSIGLDAFVLDYRVKPYTFPYPLLDARRAVRYVRKNAELYGIDADKIAIMGSSAGGHLAALTSTYKSPVSGEGVDELDEVDFMPNAQILCYPVLDIMGHPGSFLNLLGPAYATHKKVTPTLLADKDTPPLFLWHTSSDAGVDVNNSLRYAERLHEFGVPIELHIYPVGGHGLGLANDELHNCPYVRGWADNLKSWLLQIGFLNK